MAKNAPPIITHTEILARAIGSIEAEITDWSTKCSSLPDSEALLAAATKELSQKLDALRALYRIETGSEF